MIPIDELIAHIFEGKRHPILPQLEEWIKESRRFRAFVEAYRGKIRKKQRVATDDEEIKSLVLELEVAHWLLTDSRCEVEYEKLAPEGGRTPDFTVAFRKNTLLNIEVTRMRIGEGDANALQAKVISTIGDKLGQMQSNSINLLVIGCDLSVPLTDVNGAMTTLLQAAQTKNDAFFAARRFKNSTDFLKQFQRLGGVTVWGTSGLWVNKVAQRAIPKEIVLLLNKNGG